MKKNKYWDLYVGTAFLIVGMECFAAGILKTSRSLSAILKNS